MNAAARTQPLVPEVLPFLATGRERPATRFPVAAPRLAPHDLTGLSIGDLDICRLRMSAKPIRTLPSLSPRCLILLRAFGPLIMRNDRGVTIEIADGELGIASNSTGLLLSSREPTMVTGLILPISLLAEFGVKRPTATLRAQTSGTLVAPMWRFIDSLLDQPLPWPSISAYYAEKLVHELVASVLLEAAALPAIPLTDRSLVDRARQHLTAYARDPRLTPQTVADSLGVPLRRLQRRFADVDSSLGQEVRGARAAAATAMIRSPEGAVLDMNTIAELCGYPNAVAMRRAFANLGLDPPRTYRAVASTQAR